MHNYKTYEGVKDLLIDLGILIPQGFEDDYCKKNRLMFVRNDNGSAAFCAYSNSLDYKSSRIDFNLNSGAVNDKANKQGSHHFLEHLLFTKSLRDKFISNDIQANAYTTANKIQLYIEGVNNSKYPHFGINAVLKDSIEALIKPKGIYDNEFIKYEKEVVKKEIDQRDSDFYRASDLKLESLLFEDASFTRVNIPGSYESLHSLKTKDLENIINKYVTPKNLCIAIGGEGEKKETIELFKNTNSQLKKFNRIGVDNTPKTVKNPLIKDFMHFNYLEARNEKVKNDLCAVGFVTKISEEIYSKRENAMNAVALYLEKVYFERIRDKGLVYSGYIDRYSFLTGDNIFYAVGYVSSKNATGVMTEMKLEFDLLLKELLDKKTLHKFFEEYKTSLLAYPISYVHKIKDFLSMYPTYKLIANSSRYKELRTDFSVEYLDDFASKLLDTKKVLFKIGDF